MFFLEQNEGSSGSKYFKLVHKKKTHDSESENKSYYKYLLLSHHKGGGGESIVAYFNSKNAIPF